MAEDTSSGTAAAESGTDIRTFLFADLRGYTRFTQDHGDEAASALAGRFADLVRAEVPAFDGELLELRGDEALCVFRSARQALRAAVELQRRFRATTDGEAVLTLGVGMGVDAGEAVPTQGGYRGASLNLAARLCARAKPGQVLASESAAHLARRVDGLRFVSRGVVRVKGIAEPVRLVEVVPVVPLPPVPVPPQMPGSRRRRVGRRTLAASLTVGVLVVGTVAGWVATRSGASPAFTVRRNAVVLLTGNGHVHAVGMVGAAPSGLAVGGGWVWVTNRDDGTVTGLRLDGEPGERIPVGTAPTGIAYDSGAVWVADSGSGAVVRLDPALGSVKRIKTGNGPQGVAVSAGHVWVSNSLDATVSEIDPDTDTVVDQIPVGPDPTAIVAAAGEIWVANTISDTVSRIDTRSGHALPAVPVQDGPDALAVSGGSLWVANGDSSTVSHINTTQARVTETFSAGLHPRAIAVAAGTIWVADSRGSMVGLDPSAPTRRIRAALTGVPVALASTADGVWATVEPPLTGHRGGTLRALGEFSPPDPIDPAISFTPPGWQVLTMTNDGLTSFRRVSGPQGETVVPDLASMIPQPTDGGLTYTFELRRGVRYSTGRPLRAGDFRRALERVFDAGVGDGYYDNIVGAAACEHRPPPVRCQLRRGIETDDSAGTVRFHLVHADPDFPAKLALPFADAVPSGLREPPFCAQPRCGYSHQPPPVPATGPYMVVSTNLRFNTRGDLMLVRNPQFHEWSAAAQPAGYPDRIAYHFGQTPQREASQVEEGTADWSSDGAPPKTLAHLSATIPTQIHRNGALGVFALTLDTRAPPFTSRLARQAVNYAINRTLLTSIAAGTTADLACQVLPPGMLGYVPYCPYTKHVAVGRPSGSWLAPDVERARRLVKESGTEGVRVTFSLVPTGINSPAPTRTRSIQFGETVVAELRSIGYNAQLRLLSTDIPPVGAQMATMWWFDDYPAPSDFLQLFFSCNHRPTAFIPTQFCDPTLDRQMAKAVQLQPVDLTAAAARWANVDHDMTDQAPWVALYTPTNVDVVSRRVGNYQYNPQSWILLDQLWVR